MSKQLKFDSHNHTVCSHDAVSVIEDLCASAVEKELDGIVICDHGDIQYYKDAHSMDHIRRSVSDAKRMAAIYGDRLRVLAGVELGEAVWNNSATAFTKELDLDVILSSVHAVRYKDILTCFSALDFSTWDSDMLDGYMRKYFEDMYEMVQTVDMDILTHLNNPVKYINGKYGHSVVLDPYMKRIEDILKIIIERGIALEVNTTLVATPMKLLMPDRDVISLYKSLGGKYVTVGSDSHCPKDTGRHFDYALKVIADCGFDRYVYYSKRKRTEVAIEGVGQCT